MHYNLHQMVDKRNLQVNNHFSENTQLIFLSSVRRNLKLLPRQKMFECLSFSRLYPNFAFNVDPDQWKYGT